MGAFLSVVRRVGCVRIYVMRGVPNERVCSGFSCESGARGVRLWGRRSSANLFCDGRPVRTRRVCKTNLKKLQSTRTKTHQLW